MDKTICLFCKAELEKGPKTQKPCTHPPGFMHKWVKESEAAKS